MRPVIAEDEEVEFQEWLLTEYVPISGGDDSQGTGDAQGAADDQTGSDEAGASGDKEGNDGSVSADDPKDENGVPFKNRLAEERRKREKAERDLAEERARRQIEADERDRVRAEADRKKPPAEEEDLAALQFSDPEKFYEIMNERAAEKAATKIRQEFGQREHQTNLKNTFERLKEDYPDLADPESEFYQAVDTKLKERGPNFSALDLQDTVELIALRKSKKPKSQSTERPPVGETGHSRPGGKQTLRVSEEAKRVAKALGLSEKRVQAAYSRDYSDEIGTGARR